MKELETLRYKGIYIDNKLLYIIDKVKAIQQGIDIAIITIAMIEANVPDENYDFYRQLFMPFRQIAVCEVLEDETITDVNSIVKRLNSEYVNDKELTGLIAELVSV